ncbi:chemotaxis protein MotB [Quadrisphaera granulorum]|uniref:Chemotaxis protein MotB n=1 Tax=Quadrisphaera granulorum TaxID=317664 RepID=A0A316A6Y9_9ACTN|nr:flagellar motor protein MotB [Quadrisphaera granulorum]PWJ52584.1 chemotaxis protein MotB [Quadrisphaera granulorum]SZE97634.1 chemotaxis protein MotB [Quadrisphaera granulorum]
MSHGKGKQRGGGHEEEHENHERWAVSYADMMTVLMALFLVLFAMSSIDVKKFEELRTSLAQGFGNESLPQTGGSGINDGATDSALSMAPDAPFVVLDAAPASSNNNQSTTQVAGPGAGAGAELAARVEAARLKSLQDQVTDALAAKGLQDAVKTTITERGLEIRVIANDIFFANASADIQPRGLEVLDAIGPVLAGEPGQIAVEGHANHLQLKGGPYANNWLLSSARATSVVIHLAQADGVPGGRMSATGYGDTRPLFPTDDPRAIDGNRRVDIIAESDKAPEVKALVPYFAGVSQTSTTPSTTSTTTEGETHG